MFHLTNYKQISNPMSLISVFLISNIWPVSPSPFPFSLFQSFSLVLQHPLFQCCRLNATRAVFITMGLLYNSNEHWPPVIYMKWVCEFRNRHLVSGVAKQNSISSGWARRDSPCHPASHTQLPLGQHWEIGFNIDYFLSRWGVWIIDPSDVLSLTLPENITVQLSVARGLCAHSLFEHADSKSEAHLILIQTKPGTLMVFIISPYLFFPH